MLFITYVFEGRLYHKQYCVLPDMGRQTHLNVHTFWNSPTIFAGLYCVLGAQDPPQRSYLE